MLPPTMITAPTSAIARPKPASATVSRLKRASHSRVADVAAAEAERAQLLVVFLAQVLDHCAVSAATIGVTSTVCAMIIAAGV